MKKYLVVATCFFIVVFILSTRESRFEFFQENNFPKIEIKNKSATVIFVGDIMLGRNVQNLMAKNGAEYPFENISGFLAASDGVVANLEGPIVSSPVHTPPNSLSFSFASSTALLLAKHNIAVVSLANNHTYDQGVDGFNETKKFLEDAKISSAGNPYAIGAESVTRRTIGSFPIIFAAFNFTDPNLDTNKALGLIKNLRSQSGEFLVAMVHGGDEYSLNANSRQQKFYRALIDAGADLVVGHHPHVVEETEKYHGKMIFYSLGNFIFDQYFSREVQQGLAVKLTLSDGEPSYQIIPIGSIHSQPELTI